jgi:hypothetical protein
MSDGGIAGNGLTFWATVRIAGELKQPDLRDVMNRIRDILNEKGVKGEVVHSVRLTADDMPVLSIQMKESPTHAKERRRRKKR